MRLVIFGHKQHGKDTACEYIKQKFGVTFKSSSEFACEEFIFDQMKDEFGYASPTECFNDRNNHRARWYTAICAYNQDDRTRLGKRIFEGHDIYCGMRDKAEFDALRAAGHFDLAIWIDASERKPKESKDSMSLSENDADVIVTNNGTLDELHKKLDGLFRLFTGQTIVMDR